MNNHKNSNDLINEEELMVKGNDKSLSLKEQIEELQLALKESHEQLLRVRADAENSKRRALTSADKAKSYAIDKFSEDLIPVFDSLELAIEAEEKQEKCDNVANVTSGLKMTYKLLISIAEKHGLTVINPEMMTFDPNFHQAVSTQRCQTIDELPNKIISVLQKGFLLNGLLIRPAMVVVSK
ncbi:nucleotide exchange factor GrpE [Vibrio sp. SS-MA-C1-2]|uniref:nucleotide exchange factor GrpE n=1 Tax=Vibrio sp. SS-MA-C1-2 TaxID=2908646 RepID=UPI001F4362D4|nr:nucleotide exchange factor GrpE [Vibrio sp. SS-MA-C1-2]UJF16998.1 nucleotide exchange factor GrpE [Vibrio sp. SS-MA-C1-2]